MNENYEIINDIIKSTQAYGVIVDSNLLLLLLVGLIDKKLVATFKRLSDFIEDDFELLNKFLGNYNRILITPTILAEVDNLSKSLHGKYRKQFYMILKNFTDKQSKEVYKPIDTYNSSKSFLKFGVTDSNIMEAATDGPLVLTVDLPFAQFMQSKPVSVLNFNNIRTYGW